MPEIKVRASLKVVFFFTDSQLAFRYRPILMIEALLNIDLTVPVP
jgi:hypothetical protein